MDKVGKRIRELRHRRGYTLRTVGEQLGMDYAYLGKLENGKATPSLQTLEKIAEFYGVKMVDFFGEEQEIPDDLKGIGVEWIALSKDLEEQGITPEEVKEIVKIVKSINKK